MGFHWLLSLHEISKKKMFVLDKYVHRQITTAKTEHTPGEKNNKKVILSESNKCNSFCHF